MAFFLKEEGLLKFKYLGPGIVITNYGMNEIEHAFFSPAYATMYFRPHMIKTISIDKSLIELMRNMKKARRDFLQEVNRVINGNELAIVNSIDIANTIGVSKFLLDRIYWYLLEEGLIQSRYNGGGISITHSGIKEIDNLNLDINSVGTFWEGTCPDIGIVDDLIDAVDQLNITCKAKVGFEIFNNRANLYRNLRISITNLLSDIRNENAFVMVLLSIASIIDDVNYDEIKKRIHDQQGSKSLYLIQKLFTSYDIVYSESALSMLRKLHKLRSTTPPIHLGTSEMIKILKNLRIAYPIKDFAAATDVCLRSLLESLLNLIILK